MSASVLDIAGLECLRGSFSLDVPALSLSAGQIVAVAGPSGCGKSTLLDIIGLVLQPVKSGTFCFCGVDISALWSSAARDVLADLRAEGIGYILQTGGLLPFVDVRTNMYLSARRALDIDPVWERRLLDVLGIRRLLSLMPAALSVGERQRVAVARALLYRPSLVLADEPTAALDPVRSTDVMALLLELVREAGSALLVVTHDHDLVDRTGIPSLVASAMVEGDGVARTTFMMAGG